MSVLADFQVNGLNPSVVGGTGVTIKYFPRLLGSAIGVQSSTPSATSAAGQLVIPAFNELNGQLFKVKIAGSTLTFTGSTTFDVQVAVNTGTVSSPTYTTIARTGAVGAASTLKNAFALEINLYGTTDSGLVAGWYDSMTILPGGTMTAKAQAALDNPFPVQNINFGSGLTAGGNQGVPFGLVVGVVFATSIAGNSASLYQFQVTDGN
jgi:hypothetical protein